MKQLASLPLVFALLLGCSSAAVETRGTAAEVPASAPEVSPGSGVLRAGFDASTLAPSEKVASAAPLASSYTCPHHPEVVSDKPGICPKCKMDLVPAAPAPGGHDHGGHDHGAHDHGARGPAAPAPGAHDHAGHDHGAPAQGTTGHAGH